ncbi:set1/Ash2 histone methyltransferase complex subunit ASH2-like [Patiria miniata]|uniref:B30.2/SPRY domain-containing protein n=1 Tax=Patiria miniata TaxID=46514 RepID=A0A914ACH6_PATMI|nr:set1/Ash2 histone methyltransferase complex subunit ASH2-like [Patiria miniata]
MADVDSKESSATEVEEDVAMDTGVVESFDVAESQEVEMEETVSPSDQESMEPPCDDDGASTDNMDNKENVAAEVSSTDAGGGKLKEAASIKGDCYCGKERSPNNIELQCSVCLKWFHKDCITCNVGNCIPYMMTYSFCCKYCNPTKSEVYSRRMANFSQLCHMALANLTAQQRLESTDKIMFSKEKDLIPFINQHWEALTPMQRRTTTTWHATIVKAMTKDSDIFICKEKLDTSGASEEDYPLFGLIDQDLTKISPNYDPSKQSSTNKGELSQKLSSSLSASLNGGSLSSSLGKSRGTKRKGLENSQNITSGKKTRNDMITAQKLPPHGYPLEHPFNKDGYRYILTEQDPHAPSSAFEEDMWIGKPIPALLYRMALGREVYLASHDRAPQLKISENRLSVTGEKGYSMVRCTHGTNRGAWYMEMSIDDMPEGTATRIGWSQPLGNLQAPLGYDKFSYSWRSRKGTRFHQSIGKRYGEGYGQGDVLGLYIKLPSRVPADKLLPLTYKDRALIKFKSHLYFEEKDLVQETENDLKPCSGSKIAFFKNGVSQGVAFEDIFEGTYYPSISVHKGCTVSVNFGPQFKYPPQDLEDFLPISELAHRAMVEQSLANLVYHVDHEQDFKDASKGLLPQSC